MVTILYLHPTPSAVGESGKLSLAQWVDHNYVSQIWDALHAAAEADLTLAQAIVDSAGVIVQRADLTICCDERGAKYELPKYVLSEPTNLIDDN
ncbi:ubiquitin domain-containing protein 2-like [Eucalyptus grandis]|uniref:ubiquitin domain-containing protein 2-like n=1 Tax=Eucalyptus grandis TaxID=71139 RepID=UPI00192EF12D|nr:ubiquitin domain-containing protein 2-like [Eucalyptus grandis]